MQFFLRPLYTLEDNKLELTLEVCDTIGRKVSSRIHTESSLGTDIFTELDELSLEVVNSIADTDLTFEGHIEGHIEESLEGKRKTKVWRDGLERVEKYWLRYGGLQLSASGTAREIDASAGTGISLSPASPIPSEGYHERGSILRIPMMLTEPYFTGIEELRAELRPEGGAAMLLWNYRARDSYNFLRIKGSTITLHINGYERRFLLEEDLDRKERWIDLRCSRTGAREYEVAVGGKIIGTATGPDLASGRLGLGIEGGPASFRNLEVKFSE